MFLTDISKQQFARKIVLTLSGNLRDLDTGNIHQCLHKLAGKYGPIMHIKVFKRNIVVLSSGDVLRKAFRSSEFRELLNDKPKGNMHLI